MLVERERVEVWTGVLKGRGRWNESSAPEPSPDFFYPRPVSLLSLELTAAHVRSAPLGQDSRSNGQQQLVLPPARTGVAGAAADAPAPQDRKHAHVLVPRRIPPLQHGAWAFQAIGRGRCTDAVLLFVRQFFYVPPATAKETYLSPGLYAYWVWSVAT